MKKIVLFFAFCVVAFASKAQITTTPAYLSFVTPVGTESVGQLVRVSVTTLAAENLTITAPNGFRVSFDDTTWSASISTALSPGITLGIPVYVDFIPTDSNCYSNGLLLSVAGLTIVNYPLCGNGTCPIMAGFPADSFSVFIDEFCSGPKVTVATNYYIGPQNLKTYYGDGTSDVTALIPGWGSVSGTGVFNHIYALPGTYTLKTIIMNGTTPVDSVTYSYEHKHCETIPVKYYYDANSNCSYNAGTDRLITSPVLTEIDSNGISIDTISSSTGFYYNAYGNSGDVYSFKVLSAPADMKVSCPASGIITDTLSVLTYNDVAQYVGMLCLDTGRYDLVGHVNATGTTGRHMQSLNLSVNHSYCSGDIATVTLYNSPKYVFNSSTPVPTSVIGNKISWDISSLGTPGASTTIGVELTIPGGVGGTWLIPGDTIMTECVVKSSSDSDTTDNTTIIIDTVKSSYDPNEMSVKPAYCIPSGSVTQLEYTIGFENTGNAPAQNIYVLDTLPDNVNIKTLRIVASSAVMNIYEYTAGGHNVLKFDFPGINLLDSSHHGQCDGMVIFNINTIAGIPDGATLFNEAGIYFDDNPVVMTNSVQNLTGCPTSVPTITNANTVSIFPNPAANQLTIQASNTDYTSFTITNMVGQQLIQQPLTATETKVNTTILPSGIYFITFKSQHGELVKKFVKM